MTKRNLKLSALALVLGVSASLVAPIASAQTTAAIECPGYEKGKTTLVGERTGKKVQKAFEAYSEDRVEEAIQILSEIDASDDFDKAYVGRFIGNLLAGQEGQGTKALGYLKAAVSPKVLNDNEHAQTLKLIGDLSMQEQKYSDAIKYYQDWMEYTCKEDADVYTRITQAYYESKQLDKMVDPANKAIALYEEPNKNPYVLKLTSFYERKMYPQTVEVAEELVRLFPENDRWWTQLGFFYMLVEDFKKALSTFDMAYQQGFLKKENEFKTLAQLFASNGSPYKAATIMSKHLQDGSIKKDEKIVAQLANMYHQAKEYKLAAKYYGEAAELSSDPDYFRKQGSLLVVAEDYKGAIVALNKALERGVEDPGKVHFTLMEANFYSGNFKQAYVHVVEAKKDATMARNAKAWEPYIKDKAKNRGIKL